MKQSLNYDGVEMFTKVSYPHTVSIKLIGLNDIFVIISWLEANAKHKWSYRSQFTDQAERVFSFEDEEDAIIFALKYR